MFREAHGPKPLLEPFLDHLLHGGIRIPGKGGVNMKINRHNKPSFLVFGNFMIYKKRAKVKPKSKKRIKFEMGLEFSV